MNPNDLFLRQQPPQQPSASTSTPSTSQPQPNGTLASASDDPPKSTKEQEQDKKDLELAQLLEMMDDYKPIIPDEVTDYYLQRSGFDTNDVRVKRLMALAAQRFISSISADAFQYARARTAAGPGGRGNQATQGAAASASGSGQAGGAAGQGGQQKAKGRQRTVLTMDDLSAALKEYGVDAGRAAYYL